MAESAAARSRGYAPRMAPEARRAQLLDVVLDIINADGVGAVTVDGVARRARVSRPVVYGLFADADDLLRASLDREEQRALAPLAEHLPGPGTTDVGGALTGLAAAYLQAVAAATQRWRAIYLIADSGTPALHRRVERARTGLAHRIEQALRGRAPATAGDDPELLARFLLADLWEAGRLLLTRPDDYPVARLLAALRRQIATGTQPPS